MEASAKQAHLQFLERCSREICMAMWRLTTCFVIWLRSGGLSWYVCYRYDDHL